MHPLSLSHLSRVMLTQLVVAGLELWLVAICSLERGQDIAKHTALLRRGLGLWLRYKPGLEHSQLTLLVLLAGKARLLGCLC